MHMEDTKTHNGPHNSILDSLPVEVSPRLRDLAIDPALQLLDVGGAPSDSDRETSPSLQLQHSTHEENLRQLDPSLSFALDAYPEHAFQVAFMDDIQFWVDLDRPARAPDSQALRTAPSAALHQLSLAQEGLKDSQATLRSASALVQPVPTPRTRRKRTPVVDTEHPQALATPGSHPVVELTLLSPALDLESTKAPLFAPQRPAKKKPPRAHGPTPGIAKRTRHDGTLVPAYPCARCVEKDLECRICYVGGACNVCRAVARKCDLVNQEKKYNSWVDSCRTHKKGGKV